MKRDWDYHTKRWEPTPYGQGSPWKSTWINFTHKKSQSWDVGQAALSCSISASRSVTYLNKGISTLMTNNHAFYTIPEIEVVYQKPGKPDTDPQRLILNKQGW